MSIAPLSPIATPSAPSDESLYEVVDGQRVELPPMGAYESSVASFLSQLLGLFGRKQKLGRAFEEMLFELGPDLQRRPDVAFVGYPKWPRGRRVPRVAAWAIVPDLAVEVVSTSNTHAEIGIKVLEYFAAGVQLVWVIAPDLGQVHVYTSPKDVRILDESETLDGGAVAPGFEVPVSWLFATEETEESAS
jgi:Uma2 family endonuclease